MYNEYKNVITLQMNSEYQVNILLKYSTLSLILQA